MGVSIAAWLMNGHQPNNGFLVIEILKIGLIVREWDNHKELVSASIIDNIMRKLTASAEGDNYEKSRRIGRSSEAFS